MRDLAGIPDVPYRDFISLVNTTLYGTDTFDDALFSKIHDTYTADVLEYFARRPDDLLIINICSGEGWTKLCAFLQVVLVDARFPHENHHPIPYDTTTADCGSRISGGTLTHFEIRADVPHRAAVFYSAVFDWHIKKVPLYDELWTIGFTEPGRAGVIGGLSKRTNRDAVILRFDVPSLSDCLKRILANGGRIVGALNHIPALGIVAYCHDTEGNAFEICERRRQHTRRVLAELQKTKI